MGNCIGKQLEQPRKTLNKEEGKQKTKRKKRVSKKKTPAQEWYIIPNTASTSSVRLEYKKQIESLKNVNVDDVPIFTFDGKLLVAKMKLHDGDTGNICYFYNDELQKKPLRFFGCDAPEIHPSEKKLGKKISENSELFELFELEKKAGHYVLQELDKEIKKYNSHDTLWIKFTKNEKYGRLMGRLFPVKDGTDLPSGKEVDIVKWLIDKKYAKPYFGKAKEVWTKEELLYIINN